MGVHVHVLPMSVSSQSQTNLKAPSGAFSIADLCDSAMGKACADYVRRRKEMQVATMVGLTFEAKPIEVCPMGFHETLSFWTNQVKTRFQRPRYFQELAQVTLQSGNDITTFALTRVVEATGKTEYRIQSTSTNASDSYFTDMEGWGPTIHEAWMDFKDSWHNIDCPFGDNWVEIVVGHDGEEPIYRLADKYVWFE